MALGKLFFPKSGQTKQRSYSVKLVTFNETGIVVQYVLNFQIVCPFSIICPFDINYDTG